MAVAVVSSVAVVTMAACSSSSSSGSSAGSDNSSGSGSASGFNVNTGDCNNPNVNKVVTGSWTVGYSLPLSGPVAGVVEYSMEGWKARIKAFNDAGGIDGVKINVKYLDDQFTPSMAKTNVTQFIESDHVDSLITFGTGSVGAMADLQNADCVPLLYPSSSVEQYRDISNYPWTVQFLPSGTAEARYDVKYILSRFPSGATVGIAQDQTQSGLGEYKAFVNAAKGTKLDISVVADETDPNAAATKLAAGKVEVVYNAGITNECGPLVTALQRVGFTPKLVLNPSNCADSTGYVQAGEAANGNVVPSYLKNPADPALANDPGVKEYLSQVTTANKDNSIAVAGWVQADLLIHTLQLAAKMPGGLTQANAIRAARNMTYASPMLPNGISWISKPNELIGMSGFQTLVWNAATKTFTTQGGIIDLSAS
ncbi:amino acid/amide ABC transporter substrate-binding protein (HAAT family) [Rudaeicoccus suwonensis]|uniref:Amino acid/amide ABC transporter substrate-binding protein (HAAT family) n=2 Tax=Rudaeicoccus suwonensis TaxID=657409 RepID=A0A561DX21_9MICO|nr:amino acid/amide ABC transporter substrate-binding protein (HAAT family) [Rudaeicoccus suwonensis]